MIYCLATLDGFAEFGWKLRQVLFWTKALYSLLSLPFALFMMPLFYMLFSTAPATGYNKAGECCRLARNQAQEESEYLDKIPRRKKGAKVTQFSNPMLEIGD